MVSDNQNDTTKKPQDNKQPSAKTEELTEEERILQEELSMLVDRLEDADTTLHIPALEALRNQIRSSTSSMTSVPKPLKLLKDKVPRMKETHEAMMDSNQAKKMLSDILSVLSMVSGEESKRNTLHYRLSGSSEPAGSWGHEYIKHLSMEIIQESESRLKEGRSSEDLLELGKEIIPFHLLHNAEADACDFAVEMSMLDYLVSLVDMTNFPRVCLYLLGCANFEPSPDDVELLKVVHTIYQKLRQWPNALVVALKLNDQELIQSTYSACNDILIKRQLAYLIARQRATISELDETALEILSNSKLHHHYMLLAKEFGVLEPKLPEDIYKSHLENTRYVSLANVDTAKQNLAAIFVNGFINCGFGSDKLIMTEDESKSFIYNTKEHGFVAAVASIGLIKLWDIDDALNYLDKFISAKDDMIKAGAILGIGLVNTGIDHESDPALALLSEHVNSTTLYIRLSAILGLGIAYAGTSKEAVLDTLLPILSEDTNMEVLALTALALGMTFCGSCHGDLTSSFVQIMMEKEEAGLKSPFCRFLPLSLALLFLGKRDQADTVLETVNVIENSLGKQSIVLLTACAYAGTGNVLKVQELLKYCSDHVDNTKEDDLFQAFAVIGIALIVLGEDIGAEMVLRTFNHLMHYGEPIIKKAVPLGLALLHASNPKVQLFDPLSKYTHDHDQNVALSAILALGIIGTGTNNARLAQLLRSLASYYHKEADLLFMVRIAQGLIHAGKGIMSLSPLHTNRSLISLHAISGLLSVLVAMTDAKEFFLGKYPHLLYLLTPSFYPRFLQTLDENLNPLTATVRVGQAVDTVGQAGRPKTITGFQTQTTPVLLAYTERAELATEEYLPLCEVLEGFVLLKKNPEYVPEERR